MSFKLTLHNLLSETRKMVNCGPHKIDSFKEEIYRLVSQSYSKLHQTERFEYLRELSQMHDYDKDKLYNIKAHDTSSDALRIRRIYTIKESLQPKYRMFFINLGRVPDGIKLVVDLRSDIMDIQRLISSLPSIGQRNSVTEIKKSQISEFDVSETTLSDAKEDEMEKLKSILYSLSSPENSSNLFVLNAELKDLINIWFAGGFCQLERVTWDSSCQLLQRISELEAVHPIRNWLDIKRRVGDYRRCYVFTHQCMPKEPVIILHTALCEEIPATIREVVHKRFSKSNITEELEDASKIKSAVFYSISSPHTGLNSIDLGNTLIKRVVHALISEFPTLDKFSTLSPLPGFRKWLDAEIQKSLYQEINNRLIQDETNAKSSNCRILTAKELNILSEYLKTSTEKDLLSRLRLLLEWISPLIFDSSKDLVDMSDTVKANYTILSWFLKKMAAKYLCNEKHRGYALDPVCNFHLKNGAGIWRINWPADSSVRGIQNSYGVMVNYRYYINKTEQYSQEYISNKKIEISSGIAEILQDSSLTNIQSPFDIFNF